MQEYGVHRWRPLARQYCVGFARIQMRIRIVNCAVLIWLLASHAFSTAAVSDRPLDQTNAIGRRFKIPKRLVDGFPEPRPDSAKVALGERLFLETRFSQFYFANSHGEANRILSLGDPVVTTTVRA